MLTLSKLVLFSHPDLVQSKTQRSLVSGLLNPLTLMSDKLLISLYKITLASHIKVMRKKEMITNKEQLFLVKQTLFVSVVQNV